MLILSRRSGEALTVGDDITVTILDFKKDRVRIGISAPKEVAVHREEIYNRIAAQRENETQADDEEPLPADP